jgi:hypothetical protein
MVISPRQLASALFVTALWPQIAGAFEAVELVSDFVSVCIEGLPNVSDATTFAEQQGYTALVQGITPEIDAVLLNDPDFMHFARANGGQEIISLRIAVKSVSGDDADVIGSDVVSLCELGTTQGNVKQFVDELSERLRLEEPTTDIVNSGKRERMWDTLVSYNRSSIILKQLGADQSSAFTVGLVVPHQGR